MITLFGCGGCGFGGVGGGGCDDCDVGCDDIVSDVVTVVGVLGMVVVVVVHGYACGCDTRDVKMIMKARVIIIMEITTTTEIIPQSYQSCNATYNKQMQQG